MHMAYNVSLLTSRSANLVTLEHATYMAQFSAARGAIADAYYWQSFATARREQLGKLGA